MRFKKDRKPNDEFAAPSGALTLGFDTAAVHLDQLLHNAESHTQAPLQFLERSIALGKHLNHSGEEVGRDPNAGVLHASDPPVHLVFRGPEALREGRERVRVHGEVPLERVQQLPIEIVEGGVVTHALTMVAVEGRIHHVKLDRISPFAVSIIAGIGKEFVSGEALDESLDEAVAELVAEAMAD